MSTSPRAQADDFKRARDLEGEIGALLAGDAALRNAPWYPAAAGDRLEVHYGFANYYETYIVTPTDDEGLVLAFDSVTPDTEESRQGAGCFARADYDDPFCTPWMEAGPSTLRIIRNGVTVHQGAQVPN
ncbi:hypothetical protein [Streptomyces noursei]